MTTRPSLHMTAAEIKRFGLMLIIIGLFMVPIVLWGDLHLDHLAVGALLLSVVPAALIVGGLLLVRSARRTETDLYLRSVLVPRGPQTRTLSALLEDPPEGCLSSFEFAIARADGFKQDQMDHINSCTRCTNLRKRWVHPDEWRPKEGS